MSKATNTDRARAARLLDEFAPMGGTRRLLAEIAAALADERAKARAPFLALADNPPWGVLDGGLVDSSEIIEAIRAADQDET